MSKEPMQLISAIGIAFLGLYGLLLVKLDSDSLYNHSRAAFLVSLFGREGARWFIGGIGFFLLLVGLTLVLSWLYEPS